MGWWGQSRAGGVWCGGRGSSECKSVVFFLLTCFVVSEFVARRDSCVNM